MVWTHEDLIKPTLLSELAVGPGTGKQLDSSESGHSMPAKRPPNSSSVPVMRDEALRLHQLLQRQAPVTGTSHSVHWPKYGGTPDLVGLLRCWIQGPVAYSWPCTGHNHKSQHLKWASAKAEWCEAHAGTIPLVGMSPAEVDSGKKEARSCCSPRWSTHLTP